MSDTLRGACPVPLEPIRFGPPRDVVSDHERAHSFTSPIVLRQPAPVVDLPEGRGGKPTPPKRPANSGSFQPRTVTEAERADILTRYQAGESREAIGRALHRSDATVNRVITQAGLALRNDSGGNGRRGHDLELTARIAEMAPRIADLYGAGLSMQQVATVLGLGVSVVRRVMADHQIPARPSTPPDQKGAA